jgi:hypothetical protein
VRRAGNTAKQETTVFKQAVGATPQPKHAGSEPRAFIQGAVRVDKQKSHGPSLAEIHFTRGENGETTAAESDVNLAAFWHYAASTYVDRRYFLHADRTAIGRFKGLARPDVGGGLDQGFLNAAR